MSFKYNKFTPKELQRMKDFVTPDLRESYLLFKDKNEHPDNYVPEKPKDVSMASLGLHMLKFLQSLRKKFVK